MTRDERLTYAALALVDWTPDYPGQKEPKLVVWFVGEGEGGLSGFHSKQDRDAFSRGERGPFLRRVTGNTYRQMPMTKAKGGCLSCGGDCGQC